MGASGQMVQESETRISTDFPKDLFDEIQRIAQEENWQLSQAVILLARMGANSQRGSEANLAAQHARFLNEKDSKLRDQAGDDLLRSIFGPDSIG
jgi:hypothetical protein